MSLPQFPIRRFYCEDEIMVEIRGNQLDAVLPGDSKCRDGSPVTFAVYFDLITRFIRENWNEFADLAATHQSRYSESVIGIDIVAEKHGQDYHPARIRIRGRQTEFDLVANICLAQPDVASSFPDFDNLKSLYENHAGKFLPKVYFRGKATNENCESDVFIGEWLTGFHEFHPGDESPNYSIKLWDRNHGYKLLNKAKSCEILRQCSYILTYYYDYRNFWEIYPWHHAAGDFVAAIDDDTVRVKLITVRQYAPRIDFPDNDSKNAINALLVFFGNLSLRMRLDRYNGVGETVWAPNSFVPLIIRGFFDGLRDQVSEGRIARQELSTIENIYSFLSLELWAELFSEIIAGYNPRAPEFKIIEENLTDHIYEVYHDISLMFQSI